MLFSSVADAICDLIVTMCVERVARSAICVCHAVSVFSIVERPAAPLGRRRRRQARAGRRGGASAEEGSQTAASWCLCVLTKDNIYFFYTSEKKNEKKTPIYFVYARVIF